MDVFRHDDVAHQGEAITIAHLIQNLDENIPGMNRAQERQAPVTTEGDEMKMAVPLVTNQSLGHGTEKNQTPDPSKKTEGSGTLKTQTSKSALTCRSDMIQP